MSEKLFHLEWHSLECESKLCDSSPRPVQWSVNTVVMGENGRVMLMASVPVDGQMS